MCENSKNLCYWLDLPNLNHYLLESLENPKGNSKQIVFWFIDSKFYNSRVQKRSKLTKEVVEKNNIKTISTALTGKDKIIQSFEMLQLGSWATFYLAMLNDIDPVNIPWVEWFKAKLK